MAPETLRSELQGYEIDNWALGILLYEFYMNREPYAGSSQSQVLKNVRKGPIRFDDKWIPKAVQSVISGL